MDRHTGRFVGMDGCKAGWVFVPSGLPTPGQPKRLCDTAARHAIAPRWSSVFPVPARPALACDGYEEACEVNFRVLGRRLSRQTWAIAKKSSRSMSSCGGRGPDRPLARCTPRWCSGALNGNRPLTHAKKRTAGSDERLEILSLHYAGVRHCLEACTAKYPRTQVARDDILDAIAGAVAARFTLATLPAKPPRDEEGLPMEIVYPVIS